MKNFLRKGIIFSLIGCLTFGLLFVKTERISAHEAYYSNGVGARLRWAHVNNSVCYVKISTYNLSSVYSPYYTQVIHAWPNASIRVSVTATTFSESNIDLTTPTKEQWERMFGGLADFIYGRTERTSTDGVELNSYEAATASSGLIAYASCLFTPLRDFDEVQKKGNMVHEIGHALGLGHSNIDFSVDDPSIMRSGTIENYWTPQTHDINDLEIFYNNSIFNR